MNGKIIDSHRYKKVAREKVRKNNKKIHKEKLNKIKNKRLDKHLPLFNNVILKRDFDYNLKDNTEKVEKNKKFKISILLKPAVFVISIALIIVLLKLVINVKESPILSVFSNGLNKDSNLVSNYNLNIGISKLDTTDYLKTKNLILNELALKSNLTLVKYDKNYKIIYSAAKSIESISDNCYSVILNPIYKLDADDVINSVNYIKSIGVENIYYSNVVNINKVEKISDDKINIYIVNKDPFLIYKLNFPLVKADAKTSDFVLSNVDSNKYTITNNSSKYNVSNITLNSYADTDKMVDDFKNEKIDVFTASSDSIMQLIGKKDYGVKKYRDGETIFLLGNKNSSLFKRKEVRQAIAYSINRDEIVKNVDNKFSEVIDIPYIYSDIKYKYDLYAAENSLLLNGWKKTGGIYNKNDGYEYKKIELNLLVNKDDSLKCNVADNIKEMVEKIGIKIDVIKISEKEINDKISKGDYDLVLSTLNINDNPNIDFLYDYINVDEITNSAIENIKNSNSSNIEENINTLKNSLYSEVACIGILAKTTNVVYQRYISGFENLSYMKIFDNLENIGKIEE